MPPGMMALPVGLAGNAVDRCPPIETSLAPQFQTSWMLAEVADAIVEGIDLLSHRAVSLARAERRQSVIFHPAA
jgi:hypothetical protein